MLLNSQVLVLNRLWQAVNICSARRAFALLYAGHAQVVAIDADNNFFTHDFSSWRDFSAQSPEREMVTTISFKVRVPRVIVLVFFDRLPKKARARPLAGNVRWPLRGAQGRNKSNRASNEQG